MMTPPFSISARPRLTRAVPRSSLTRSLLPSLRLRVSPAQGASNRETKKGPVSRALRSVTVALLEDLHRPQIAVDEVLMIRRSLVVFDDGPQLRESGCDHDLCVASFPPVTGE